MRLQCMINKLLRENGREKGAETTKKVFHWCFSAGVWFEKPELTTTKTTKSIVNLSVYNE